MDIVEPLAENGWSSFRALQHQRPVGSAARDADQIRGMHGREPPGLLVLG
jgi:hypothetical protein